MPNFIQVENMSSIQQPISHVSDFYKDKTVFITGGTGFMGKVLLEKLLRSCGNVNKIYLLIRPKKGQNAHERLQQLISAPLFDKIRNSKPDQLRKVLPIEGDITEPELAISLNDRNLLARTVNIVFHSAATVKFDEKLKLSVTINMLGTQRLVELCTKMSNLEALVHVSTAYCNCNRSEVLEKVYQVENIRPEQMTALVECLDETILDSLTERLVGDRPNTYTFTKALAECWLQQNCQDLPLVIVRPSIVLSSANEPLEGWVDNWNGPTGIIAAAGKGVFRTMLCAPSKTADLVPVDMVINLLLVSAWKMGTTKSKELKIYNCCTGTRKPITWQSFIDLSFKYMRRYPFSEVTWYPDGTVTSYRLLNKINQILFHWIPAFCMDGLVKCVGGKPIMLRIQDKLTKAAVCLEYFTMQEWKFVDDNVIELNSVLSEEDRQKFNFDVEKIDWEEYIRKYILGIRSFIFKEDTNNLDEARQKMVKLYWSYKCIQVMSVLAMWHFLTLRYAPLRQLWSNALRLLIHLAKLLPIL